MIPDILDPVVELNDIVMFAGGLFLFTLKPMELQEVHQDMICSSLFLPMTSDMDILVQSGLLEPIKAFLGHHHVSNE